ncbi:hypothetical protein BRADI_3g29322v3 [Brachypodium distachyon]|uniref:DUF3615 domain-containing protein n=1 Tax=Brachypodium distachyon TaxID=15368 RepID=A0A2K2CZY8_BRADI|nr:hypothetical protein BRADI_3g29322v3 [Brachypodium distachyon]
MEEEHPPRIIGNGMVSRSIFVPANGTRPGHFIPRGSTPGTRRFRRQPPAPPRNTGASSSCEEKEHLPDPSSGVHNIAPQMLLGHDVLFSNPMLSNEMTPSGFSAFTAAYAPPYWCTQQQKPWSCLSTSVDAPSWYLISHQGAAFALLLGHLSCTGNSFTGELTFTLGSIMRDVTTRILMWAGHLKHKMKLRKPSGATSMTARIQKCLQRIMFLQWTSAVRQCLYWPDGTRKRRLRSEPVDEIRDRQRQLVLALVDKYNEDNHLSGDLAYALKDVVYYQSIFEGDFQNCYHHINFTAKPEGAVCYNLFFAEVIFMKGQSEELPVSCLCSLKPTDNGNCFGCKNNGNADMKHPNDVGYAGGHVMKRFCPFSGPRIPAGFFDDHNLQAEEANLRRGLKVMALLVVIVSFIVT